MLELNAKLRWNVKSNFLLNQNIILYIKISYSAADPAPLEQLNHRGSLENIVLVHIYILITDVVMNKYIVRVHINKCLLILHYTKLKVNLPNLFKILV